MEATAKGGEGRGGGQGTRLREGVLILGMALAALLAGAVARSSDGTAGIQAVKDPARGCEAGGAVLGGGRCRPAAGGAGQGRSGQGGWRGGEVGVGLREVAGERRGTPGGEVEMAICTLDGLAGQGGAGTGLGLIRRQVAGSAEALVELGAEGGRMARRKVEEGTALAGRWAAGG